MFELTILFMPIKTIFLDRDGVINRRIIGDYRYDENLNDYRSIRSVEWINITEKDIKEDRMLQFFMILQLSVMFLNRAIFLIKKIYF